MWRFTPIAGSEAELREYILQTEPQEELYKLGKTYRRMVSEEFETQSPSVSEPPEDTLEGTDDDDPVYHIHDL
jgi:hypothetical protein